MPERAHPRDEPRTAAYRRRASVPHAVARGAYERRQVGARRVDLWSRPTLRRARAQRGSPVRTLRRERGRCRRDQPATRRHSVSARTGRSADRGPDTAGTRETVGRALPRQQTMRALIDWSYELLTEQEKTVFRRLSAFAGSFTAQTAGAVCASADIDEIAVLDILTSLVDKSLVQVDSIVGQPRMRFLESTRQYAAE